MTKKPVSLLHVFALTAMIVPAAAAQSARTPTQPAQRSTAPAPAPRTATATPAAMPVGTSGSAATSAGARSTTGTRPWHEQEYRLGPGDKLRVEVYGEPQLSQAL